MSGQRIKGLKWRENIHFPLFGNSKKWRKKRWSWCFSPRPHQKQISQIMRENKVRNGHERENNLHLC